MNMPKPTAAAPKFSLVCPHCSAVLKAGVNLIGRRLNCPQCKEPIEIQILAVNPNAPSPTETVAAAPVPDQLTPAATVTTKTGETTLLNSHPKMFRSNPVGFVIAVLLCLLFGLGAIILLSRISQMSCLTLACNLRQPFENKGFDAFHANVIGEPHG